LEQRAAGFGMSNATQKLLVGLASLTLVDIAVAVAADLPVKAPSPAPPPIYNWSGFYVGGHAGYRWADANFSGPGYTFDPGIGPVAFPARSESYHPDGGIGGVQAGYNFMITPRILAGIEGDFTWGSGSDSATGGFSVNANDSFSFVSQTRLNWQSTIRGRLGVVNGPWLFYGTGGVAFTRVNWTDTSTFTFFGTPTASSSSTFGNTLTGAAVGAGIEYMFNPNWIARLEYLYEDFGNVNVPFGLGQQTGTLDLRDVNKVRVGISYKFNQ
jgi:opacity protein-like surface antigen